MEYMSLAADELHFVFQNEGETWDRVCRDRADLDLRRMCKSVDFVQFYRKSPWRTAVSFRPGMQVNRKSRDFASCVIRRISEIQPDLVVINHLKNAWLIKKLPISIADRIVFVAHNDEVQMSQSMAQGYESRTMRFAHMLDTWKVRIAQQFVVKNSIGIVFINDRDARSMTRSLAQHGQVIVIPPRVQSASPPVQLTDKKAHALICGSFVWSPKLQNLVDFLDSYSNSTAITEFDLRVVGMMTDHDLESLRKRYPTVDIVGPVASTKSYFREAAISLIPERIGAGTKIKSLESISYCCLIVGLNGCLTVPHLQKNSHYYECENYSEMIDQVVRSLADVDRCFEKAELAKDVVEKTLSREKLAGKMSDYLMAVEKKEG